MTSRLCLICAALLMACSTSSEDSVGSVKPSDDSSDDDSSEHESSDDDGTMGEDPTSMGSPPAVGDLSGTWDVILSDMQGDAAAMTVTLSSTMLEIDGDVELLGLFGDSLVDLVYADQTAHGERLAEQGMDLGAIPLPLSGDWLFTAPSPTGESCESSITNESVSLRCTSGVNPREFVELRNLEFLAVRSVAGDSIFGDLGGSWTISSGDARCGVVLQSQRVSVDCAAGPVAGTATFEFDNHRISGSTSGGFEFTAQRR